MPADTGLTAGIFCDEHRAVMTFSASCGVYAINQPICDGHHEDDDAAHAPGMAPVVVIFRQLMTRRMTLYFSMVVFTRGGNTTPGHAVASLSMLKMHIYMPMLSDNNHATWLEELNTGRRTALFARPFSTAHCNTPEAHMRHPG